MKFKSKFFRVATEGATTDGRKIERSWIQEMADSFDPNKYGARIWLEHMRGLYPDGAFKAYGDVVAVEAREVEDGKLALFAQISPTDELIELNKSRQKIYTSIEIREKFADTNKAYLIGLGITDSPASLGTEALAFSATHGLFNNRKQDKDNLLSEAIETTFEFDEVETQEKRQSLADLVKGLFSSHRKQAEKHDVEDFSAAIAPVVEGIVSLETQLTVLKSGLESSVAEYKTLKEQFDALELKLSTQEEFAEQRPLSTGSTSQLTDC